jgi:hypothetical protein
MQRNVIFYPGKAIKNQPGKHFKKILCSILYRQKIERIMI